ncbi:3-oxoacyl-(acyl-carrier-protein) synthase [Gillisia mitskevichiae]|uniref:3-oxoacyl-(Acyl-carrier-protein) synthase n=1 Tax=Gillisia mitskevichiae TaxID=270921 RepID=A0A495PTS6_9FLAO|nr:beta-ketoacyl synthase chain length factor [Gillisia mitskevichiae]RKS53150.1 3-oxoacyl-(acyl-carrier-protein) synthase [Gillisia mitskevichiae]
MSRAIYITGIGAISAQTEESIFSEKPVIYNSNIFQAISPNFKEYIPAMALRRMSKAIKMGLTAGKIALQDANVELPAAIITGTGEGCKQDTEKFLESMLAQEEELLTPTSFIQSTHNTVGGQIALNLKCTGYNLTYSQENASLESALIDAILLLKEKLSMNSVLVGGVDEISKKITSFGNLNGFLKQGKIDNLGLFSQRSRGTITSEGAFFFNLTTEYNENCYAKIKAVSNFNTDSSSVEISEKIIDFLSRNGLKLKDLDIFFLGKNGDLEQDKIYEELQISIFAESCQLAYKHLAGDFNTVSGFAIWLSCLILKKQEIPAILKLNTVSSTKPKNILIYNFSSNSNHSLILLQKP